MFSKRTIALLVIGAVFVSISAATATVGEYWKMRSGSLYYSDGPVGIGTKYPDRKLSVIGPVRAAFQVNQSEYTEIGHGGTNGYINTRGDGDLLFRHHGSNVASLDDSGDLSINGDMTWGEKTSFVSVAPAAFQPREEGFDYMSDGRYIRNEDGNSDYYLASVQLPQGAVVTEFNFYWNDASGPNNASCSLYRTNLIGGEVLMADAYTSGSTPGANSSTNTTITYAQIDNANHSYYVYLILPDSSIDVYGATIEYTVTQPY